MNKAELLEQVASGAGVTRQQAEGVLEAYFSCVRTAVRSGDKVAWPGFGAFSLTSRKARMGVNPRTGDRVRIRASKAVRFVSGTALKDFVNSPTRGRGAKASAPATATATSAATTSAAKKSAAKTSAKKSVPKKSAAKKSAAKKSAAKKSVPKKSAAKKSGAARSRR